MRQVLQSVTGITKCDRNLLQSVTGITKCDNYYKVRQYTPLQSTSNHQMSRKQIKKYQKLLPSPVNKSPLSKYITTKCLSTSRAYMQPIDDIIMSNEIYNNKNNVHQKIFNHSFHSCATVPSVSTVRPVSTSINTNVDSVKKCTKKRIRKTKTVKKIIITDGVTKPTNTVSKCNYFSPSKSCDSVCQPINFHRSYNKNMNKNCNKINTSKQVYLKEIKHNYINTNFSSIWIYLLILVSFIFLKKFSFDKTSCKYLRINIIANMLTGCFIFLKYTFYNFTRNFNVTFFRILFILSKMYQCFLIIIHFCLFYNLLTLLFSIKERIIVSLFIITFYCLLIKKVTFCVQIRSEKKRIFCSIENLHQFWCMFLKIKIFFSQFPKLFYSKIPYYNARVLKFSFYMFENLIDIVIFLDFIFSLISRLFKYLFLAYFPLVIYLIFIMSVIFDNNIYKSNFNTNLTLSSTFSEKLEYTLLIYNDSFLGHKEFTPTSAAPINALISLKPLIFFSVTVIFSGIFYKKKNFKITKKLLPFLIFLFCFSTSPSLKSKQFDLKLCPNSDFFNFELIKIANDINNAQIHKDFC